jgi:hypothetical protein
MNHKFADNLALALFFVGADRAAIKSNAGMAR